jgi:hypothetical protein
MTPQYRLIETIECGAMDGRRFVVDRYRKHSDSPTAFGIAYLRGPTFAKLRVVSAATFRLPCGTLITRMGPPVQNKAKPQGGRLGDEVGSDKG